MSAGARRPPTPRAVKDLRRLENWMTRDDGLSGDYPEKNTAPRSPMAKMPSMPPRLLGRDCTATAPNHRLWGGQRTRLKTPICSPQRSRCHGGVATITAVALERVGFITANGRQSVCVDRVHRCKQTEQSVSDGPAAGPRQRRVPDDD